MISTGTTIDRSASAIPAEESLIVLDPAVDTAALTRPSTPAS